MSLTTMESTALWSFWPASTFSILRARAVWLASIRRSLTNARMMTMLPLHGARAMEYGREHSHAVLGEGVGQQTRVAVLLGNRSQSVTGSRPRLLHP